MSTQHQAGSTPKARSQKILGRLAAGVKPTSPGDLQRSTSDGRLVRAVRTGVNPLYGSNISVSSVQSAPSNMSLPRNGQVSSATTGSATSSNAGTPARQMSITSTTSDSRQRSSRRAGSGGGSSVQQRRGKASTSGRRGSQKNEVSTSAMQSSSRSRQKGKRGPGKAAVAQGSGGREGSETGKSSVKRASSKSSRVASGREPAPLVPALLAPVPPPPPKRRTKKSLDKGDIEAGDGNTTDTSVLEDAPDKTVMEMVQAYLKKQDLQTRIALIGLLVVLGGGVFGAYGVIFYRAVIEGNTKFIVLLICFTVIIVWVVWKYCLNGDERQQDQSAIAQDIATLYASIPDHTARRGVTDRGRAQFTDFKYEKTEMEFTAVTDDGVSLGSERGSELMMDGAAPSCPLCNVAYQEGNELCMLPCLHVFHKSCIHKWCDTHIVCPLCKRHLEAPEPIHNLTAIHNSRGSAQSEPGHHSGAGGKNGTWRNMLGAAQPGPASGHGSERGLGGTRSEDGLWNDRVLNAAQRQQSSRGHNRVTSFSSETHRATRGRSTTPSRGPPQAGSSGARASSSGRSQSHHGGSRSERGYLQRQRSSSFTVSSERNRMGSGRVAHGTKATRGVERLRIGDTGSPRSRSDLGVGSKDAHHARVHSDALLSRHAMRHAGAGMNPVRKMFAEDGTGAWNVNNGSMSEAGSDAEVRRKSNTGGSAPGSHTKPRRGGPVQRQRSTIITVRKTRNEGQMEPDGDSASQQSKGRPSKTRPTARRERFSFAGGSDADVSRRGFAQTADEDSSPEPTTKALSYGPRKPKVSSKKRSNSVGHRRVTSTGSTSAEESSASVRKPRRRSSADSLTGESQLGGQTKAAAATATAEAAATFLKRTSTKPNKSSKSTRVGVRNATDGVRRTGEGVSSGGESSSDNRPRSIVRRRPNKTGPSAGPSSAVGTGTRAQRRSTHPMPAKQTPPKPGPTTKGTPAPPMAPARAASWNVAAGPPPPVNDASESSDYDSSMPLAMRASTADGTDGVSKSQLPPPEELDQEQEDPDKPAASESEDQQPARASSEEHESLPILKVAYAGAPTSTSAQEESPNPNSPDRRSSGGSRGWSLRIPSTSSSDYHVGGVNTGSVEEDGGAAAVGGGDPAGKTKQPKMTASKVFISSGSARFGLTSGRMFTSSGAGKIGAGRSNAMGYASDSEDERAAAVEGASTGDRRSIAELIQTYEKPRVQPDGRVDGDASDVAVGVSVASNYSSTTSRALGSRPRRLSSGTESEHDDRVLDRPKLSYKKLSRAFKRSTSGESTVRDGDEVPMVNPDGEEWGDEDPYVRPKLSYGSGISKSSSFALESSRGGQS